MAPSLESAERFIKGWKFPIVMISVVVFMIAMLTGILLVPKSGSALSAFAEDFKVWCFGYDPATGDLEWGYVWMFLVQPFIMLAVVLGFWYGPMRDVLRTTPKAILPYVAGSLVLVAVLGAGLPYLGTDRQDPPDVLAFPAESLRTSRAAIPFSLTDQYGEPIKLGLLRGRVVLVTAVYASCGDTCPLILQQTKRITEKLSDYERKDLTVVAITLDPDVDPPEIMKALLEGHGLGGSGFVGATGDPAYVNDLLDAYGFARVKDPETGMISHANKLMAIDRQGRVAYTFSLGPTQEQWLGEALQMLLAEPA